MAALWFRLVGDLDHIEVIARGTGIRELERLVRAYGPGRWRKVKGRGKVILADGRIVIAELHWYEAHGVGRKRLKIKRLLD